MVTQILKILCSLILFLSVTSCTTITRSHIPPLKESELPFLMSTGTYLTAKNETYIVTTNNPRWSVSEAYLYDSVTRDRQATPEKYNKFFWILVCVLTLQMLSLIYIRKVSQQRKK